MNEDRITINCLIEKTQEAMLAIGHTPQSVWGDYYGKYLNVAKFFRECGHEHYDDAIMREYLKLLEARLARKEIGMGHFRVVRKAAIYLKEYHDSGTLVWSYYSNLKKRKLADYFDGLLTEFLASDSLRNDTLLRCEWAIRKYLFYIQDTGHKNLELVTATDLQRFVLFCKERLSTGSIQAIIGALRIFHHYLDETGQFHLDDNSLLYATVVRESKLLPYLTWGEIAQIVNHIDRSTDIGKRDYAIIMLSVRTGLRGVDIVGLRLRDIDWRAGEINILQKKTGVSLTLPLTTDVGEAIKEYLLEARPNSDSEHIFLRSKAPYQQFSRGCAIGGMFKGRQARAGIKRVAGDGKGVHALRRTLGRSMAVSGIPVTTIAQVLGHSTLEGTKQYISLDSENLKSCALDFSGIEPKSCEVLA